MQSVLEELAMERIAVSRRLLKNDCRYAPAMSLVVKNKEKLLGKLREDEKELLERLIEAQEELNHMEYMHSFVHGYQMGLTMTAEAVMGMNETMELENFCRINKN